MNRLGDDGVAQVFIQQMQFRSLSKYNRRPLEAFQEGVICFGISEMFVLYDFEFLFF